MLFYPFMTYSVECITTKNIYSPDLISNALIRKEPGFEDDFLLLHCLLKKINPEKIFEVGTCEGYGTLIMANACPNSTIISLDLPPYTPPFYHEKENIGKKCYMPYQQVFGKSLEYNYSLHFPINAWFIDGAHDFDHVYHETKIAIESGAELIVYHDSDIAEVFSAIEQAIDKEKYQLYRVIDTRIMYAIHKSKDWLAKNN